MFLLLPVVPGASQCHSFTTALEWNTSSSPSGSPSGTPSFSRPFSPSVRNLRRPQWVSFCWTAPSGPSGQCLSFCRTRVLSFHKLLFCWTRCLSADQCLSICWTRSHLLVSASHLPVPSSVPLHSIRFVHQLLSSVGPSTGHTYMPPSAGQVLDLCHPSAGPEAPVLRMSFPVLFPVLVYTRTL
jgi:hypothetical protein